MKDSEIIGYACPICDTPNPKAVKYCIKCGHWLFDAYSSHEAKPITKKEFKKYFAETDNKMPKQKKGFIAGGLVLLAAIYLLGSANAKMVISLLVVLAG